jgi:hypothetical protein
MTLSTPSPAFMVSMLIALWSLFPSSFAAADDPPRLPSFQTFEKLESRLAEIKKSPNADAAQQEIKDAERLLQEGKMWSLAGRLKKAGQSADLLDATIVLASLRIRIAGKKKALSEALLQNARLENELSSLNQRLAKITSLRLLQTPKEVTKDSAPEEAVPSEGDTP